MSMRALSEFSSRRASWTGCWRTPSGSRMGGVLAAVSRSARSAEAAAGAGEVADPGATRRRNDEIDPGPLCPEQPGRLVHDVLEKVRRIVDRGDPGGDLAEGLLGVGSPPELGARTRKLLDE